MYIHNKINPPTAYITVGILFTKQGDCSNISIDGFCRSNMIRLNWLIDIGTKSASRTACQVTRDVGAIGLSLCSHLEITRVISRTKSGFVYVNATSPDQWPGSVVRENTRTSDPGTTFGPDQLICERYSFLGPPLWRCGLYEEERTHSGSWLHFSPPACSGSTNMG